MSDFWTHIEWKCREDGLAWAEFVPEPAPLRAVTKPASPSRIVFTGHRDCVAASGELDKIMVRFPKAIWVHGGAIGFDTQVGAFARAHNIPVEEYRPDYETYGRVAPLIRNDYMLGLPGVIAVVAVYDGRERGGTRYTINVANAKLLPVVTLRYVRERK